MSAFTRRLLRVVTSILMVAILVAMGVMVANRMRRPRGALAEAAAEEVQRSGDAQVEGIYKGFRYVEKVAGNLVFALDSVRTLGKTSGWYDIQGVRLQLYNSGEAGPVVTCEAARFNMETRDATLQGPVHVEFPGGAVLTTAHARFDAATRSFLTDSRVMFTNGDSVGQAGQAIYSLPSNRLELRDDAVLRSGGGVSLRAPLIAYDRAQERVELPDGLTVEDGGSTVTAPRAVIELDGNDGPPRRVRLDGGVVLRRWSPGAGDAVTGWAQAATAERDANGNWQVEATTDGRWIELRFLDGPGFFTRTLRSLSLRGVLSASGEILNLRGEQRVCLNEVPISGAPRRARAQSARAWFDGGQPTDVELVGEVGISAESVEARGQRARVSSKAGVAMIQGDPTGNARAVLVSDRGRVSCDQAQLIDADDRIEARGNVQGTLEEVQMLGEEPGEEASPVHFAAGVLDVTEQGAVYHMRENARLWQGHRLLLADDVVYRERGEVLDASGHVRTTLPAVQLDPGAKAGEDVVVVARSLHLDRATGTARFTGNVRYSDPRTMLSAGELTVLFDQSQRITRVEATGAVEMADLTTGRRMTGQRAVRDVASQTVLVTGSPVQLTDTNGTVISSSSLTWDQASGTVTVAGGTETIYYPEDAP